jgi:ParB-like chromosome segregation protein Spo0J
MSLPDRKAKPNLFPALDAATEAALRYSIQRFGVLVPVVKDQHGNLLDGLHRSRLADEIGVRYRVDVIAVTDEDQAREIARTLNADRRHLTPEQRREIVAALREQGHSLRAIAGAVGSSKSQVERDLSTVPDGTVPERTVGLDGKSRPAKRPTVVAAKNEREAERAQDALATAKLPNTPVIDVKRVERIAREQEAERRLAALRAPEPSSEVRLEHCDIRELDVEPGSVDLIFTDPPYLASTLDCYEHLADFAARALRPGAMLVAYTGNVHAFECAKRLGEKLIFVALGGVYMPGAHTPVHKYRLRVRLKPLMFFSRDAYQPLGWWEDVLTSPKPEKDLHPWQQSEGDSGALIEALTVPGGLVCDPFLGSGTTAVACKALGRRFLGCDIDANAVAVTRDRLAAESTP